MVEFLEKFGGGLNRIGLTLQGDNAALLALEEKAKAKQKEAALSKIMQGFKPTPMQDGMVGTPTPPKYSSFTDAIPDIGEYFPEMALKFYADQAKNGVDFEKSALRVARNNHLGLPSDPQDIANAAAFESVKRSELMLDAEGKPMSKHASVVRNAPALASIPQNNTQYNNPDFYKYTGQEMPQQNALPQLSANPVRNNNMALSQLSGQPQQTGELPYIPMPNASSPKARLEIEKDVNKKQVEQYVKEQEKQASQMSVQGVLNRMDEINEELKKTKNIRSADAGIIDNTVRWAQSSPLGQMAWEGQADPVAQALRDEYKALQSTLLPFYAKAAGLGAKSLDSEGERKSILSSFGTPEGLYESNKNQLRNLEQLLGQAGMLEKRANERIEIDGKKYGGTPNKPSNMTQAEWDRLQELEARAGN